MDRNPDRIDRDRLKQIEQSDLSESRVNQDFVDWLKSRGPNYLLIILAVLCVYMVVVRWKQSKYQHQVEAWEALVTADLPRSKEDVANEYDDVQGVATMARLHAARQYIQAVRAQTTVTSMVAAATERLQAQQQNPQARPPTPDLEPLSEAERSQYLEEAQRLFQSILDTVKDVNGAARPGELMLKVAALDGLAAVAEARGDAETARQLYEQSAEAAEPVYPQLAEQARQRAADVESAVQMTSLPSISAVGNSALVSSFEDEPTGTPMLRSLRQIIESDEPGPDSAPPSES